MITEHNCTVFNIVYNKEKRADEYVITHLYGVHWENVKAVSNFDDAVTITSVDTFDYGNSKMRHYKISGK